MLKGYEIRQLIKFFNQSTLHEFEVEKGDFKITIKKGNNLSSVEQNIALYDENKNNKVEVKNS